MKYNGTDFNEKIVLSMTKKQFLLKGAVGNKLSQEQLSECYDLIVKKNQPNADNSKYAARGTETGLTSADGEQHGGYGTGVRKTAERSTDTRDSVN